MPKQNLTEDGTNIDQQPVVDASVMSKKQVPYPSPFPDFVIEKIEDVLAKKLPSPEKGRWLVSRDYDTGRWMKKLYMKSADTAIDLGYADDYEAAKSAGLEPMTSRQCGVAAEAYAASLLSRSGYDVSVQYGANQPGYDLIAVKTSEKDLPAVRVSVKGSQDGGWMLATKITKAQYHEAINAWEKKQNRHGHLVFLFIQFMDVNPGTAPRAYVATPAEIAKTLKGLKGGRGYGALPEDQASKWAYSTQRLHEVAFGHLSLTNATACPTCGQQPQSK